MRSVGFGSRAPTERPAAHEPRATDTAAGAAVRVRDGEVRLGGDVVWSGVDATVDAGEFAAILGPNGSGKTTLLRVLLGELPLASGSVSVLGARPGARKGEIGYLPQRRHFDPGTRIRGLDLVRLGLDGARWGLPLLRSGQGRVEETIALVGASTYARRPIGTLSGGEQQRLLIAQALVRRPQLLLLDEPLDSLDLPNQAESPRSASLGRVVHTHQLAHRKMRRIMVLGALICSPGKRCVLHRFPDRVPHRRKSNQNSTETLFPEYSFGNGFIGLDP